MHRSVRNIFLSGRSQPEIARTHTNYGASEDDTIFWWAMSAFYNKQVVRNTFRCIKTFGLDQTGVFKGFVPFLIKTLIPLTMKGSHTLIGGLVAGLPGAAVGFFEDDIVGDHLQENASDDLSLFLEGSTRTRANILTYRNRDVMLSSMQNFRTGQFNFQSAVHQATLNTEVNVFTTAGFAGIDISDAFFAAVGGLAGTALGVYTGLGALGTVGGAVGGVAANEELLTGSNPLLTMRKMAGVVDGILELCR